MDQFARDGGVILAPKFWRAVVGLEARARPTFAQADCTIRACRGASFPLVDAAVVGAALILSKHYTCLRSESDSDHISAFNAKPDHDGAIRFKLDGVSALTFGGPKCPSNIGLCEQRRTAGGTRAGRVANIFLHHFRLPDPARYHRLYATRTRPSTRCVKSFGCIHQEIGERIDKRTGNVRFWG